MSRKIINNESNLVKDSFHQMELLAVTGKAFRIDFFALADDTVSLVDLF
jgi:hypothetical protein